MLSQSSSAAVLLPPATALLSVCVSVLLNCSMSPRRGARMRAAAEEEATPPGGNSLVEGSGPHLGLVWVLLAVHNGLSFAITPKSKSTSASTITADVAAAEAVAEAECFFARFLFFSVC